MDPKRERHGRATRPRRGFTLVELLVVVSIIALLIAILLPSLKKAREQAKEVLCLTRTKAMGTGVLTYSAEYSGKLPGPLHPAVYRNQTLQSYQAVGYSLAQAKYNRNRQLTWVIAEAMGQRGGDSGTTNVTDDAATCPAMEGTYTDEHFERFYSETGKRVFPTHFALNNYGSESPEGNSSSSLELTARKTNPPEYFGYSPPPGFPADTARSPQPLSRIPKASDEWMVADAWYRAQNIGSHAVLKLYKQEGPYQSGWSGTALPYQPMHRVRNRSVVTTDENQRDQIASRASNIKQDGVTPTIFFDGHSEAVASRALMHGDSEIMYGFPGTQNLDFRGLSRSNLDMVKQFVWK